GLIDANSISILIHFFCYRLFKYRKKSVYQYSFRILFNLSLSKYSRMEYLLTRTSSMIPRKENSHWLYFAIAGSYPFLRFFSIRAIGIFVIPNRFRTSPNFSETKLTGSPRFMEISGNSSDQLFKIS